MHKLKAWAIKVIYLGIALSMVLGLTLVAAPAISTVNAATSAVGIGAYDAVTKLQNQISALPASAFTNPNHKGTLLNKIEAVINQVENGAYNGAINKLDNDIKDKIEKWVVASQQATLLASADVAIASVTNASKTTITISTGKLAGADAGNNSWVWKGIPYAKPPSAN